MLCGSELLDAHHPDPEAVLQDLIPTDDEDGRGRQASEVQARQVLEVFIGRPLEQDNRPPAPFTFRLGGLQNLLWVLLSSFASTCAGTGGAASTLLCCTCQKSGHS